MRATVAGLLVALLAANALDSAGAAEPQPLWSGSAELGGVVTSGNTDSTTANARGEVHYRPGAWRHHARLDVLLQSEDGQSSAERYAAAYKADRQLDERNYLFGALRAERDRFSGFEYQVSETAGYGRRLATWSGNGFLDAEVGAGLRQSRPQGGDLDNEPIARLALTLEHPLGASSRLLQQIQVEAGPDNVFSESVTGLKASINDALALKLTQTFRHNSDVPDDRKNLDSISAITLVVDF